MFGSRLGLAERYVALLATTGIDHGLIGPRERPRLWDRHVLNCAVVADLIPEAGPGQRVIDVGSGAGLPGLVLAIARPDLDVHLVEPLARRTAWLTVAVADLGLPNVTIHTARAETLWGKLTAPWVTARAVTGIVRLAEWTLPLLEVPGQVLALKGSSGPAELVEAEAELRRLGVARSELIDFGVRQGELASTVLRLILQAPPDLRRLRSKGGTSAGSARRRRDRPRGAGGGKVSGRGRPRPGDGRAVC
ncbi:16S rRNA (guanine(527)-N(7))-methyltransferase RsmG [Intrasporangium sp.]|uniref:16S rRNA (guanine(527)-N(7))-methyltransferase RsmG n=1 Tax=Intrasporangium sp. TaxID=1925024 RepID=UPI003463F5A2